VGGGGKKSLVFVGVGFPFEKGERKKGGGKKKGGGGGG